MKLSTKLCWCGIKGRLRPQKQQQLHNTNLQMTELKKQKTAEQKTRPQNVGIKGIQIYIPTQCVNQSELEKFDGVSQGKYTIGLGQTNMSFVNDREDIYSMSLTVLSKLIKNFTSEYPYVDGHFSLTCYVKALDQVYKSYSKKAISKGLVSDPAGSDALNVLKYFDYNVFHVPTCKLVTKSYGRLLYNDFRANPQLFPEVDAELATRDYDESLTDKNIEKPLLMLLSHSTKRELPNL
ncbi:ADM_collapsed_G0040480.mRNA.1.CDS.1 [Saccharomyces cerevisiae]|nr:ADM_collapsed_G0040480.mRNA.1.CDS.1 [Saccharomyces cerevisiae]